MEYTYNRGTRDTLCSSIPHNVCRYSTFTKGKHYSLSVGYTESLPSKEDSIERGGRVTSHWRLLGIITSEDNGIANRDYVILIMCALDNE